MRRTSTRNYRQWGYIGFNGGGSDTSLVPHGEPYAGKLHVRFDEGADVPCGGVSPYSTPHCIQDNESFSSKGVVRGLHWQAAPWTQAKLVRVIRGAVWDVAVDIRKGSPTFGKHVSEILTAENHKQFFIPRGFSHGFIVLEDNTLFSYKCDNLYHSEADRGLRFDAPSIGIEWPARDLELKLSEKDLRHPFFSGIEPWVSNVN